jgi:hypothetical protein
VTELATLAVTVNVCDAPAASEPTAHVTSAPAALHSGLADTNVSPLGNGSDTRMLTAASGP